MTPTMRLRWYRPLIRTGVVESGPAQGNYIREPGEPVLQQLWIRSDREIEIFKERRGVDLPKEEWIDVAEVIEGDDPAADL